MITLEYSNTQKSFHVNYGGYKLNTNGFNCIKDRISYNSAAEFIRYINAIYGSIRPEFKEMKRLFNEWEDVNY